MYIGLTKPHLDDSHSESSGEVTTSDSGRGGSEEDIRSNMTTSHDTGLCNGKLNYPNQHVMVMLDKMKTLSYLTLYQLFLIILSEIPSKCPTVWIQIRTDRILWVLI